MTTSGRSWRASPMRRTSQGLGVPIAAGDVLLVGGTSADVAAAWTTDVPVLAVASGRSSVQELREAGDHHWWSPASMSRGLCFVLSARPD